MIDYETYYRLRDLHEQQGLNIEQIADTLGLNPRTFTKWIRADRYRPRQTTPRPGKLDPYKQQIRAWLEAHPLSAQQVTVVRAPNCIRSEHFLEYKNLYAN